MHWNLILVPVVFLLTVFGPGFLCVRRLDWSIEEKIAASLTLSLLFLGLACFGVFASGLPRAAHGVILAACAVLTISLSPGILRLLASPEARRLLAGFGLLALWVLALLGLIRNYSGGAWYGDWLEHYQRSLFFLGGHSAAETFQGYALPARPPLVNAIAAYFLALAGEEYRVYQLTDALLGLLVYFPACLIAGLAGPARRHLPGIVAIFLMLNPMFVQNATYSWTKLPAAFFVLSGVAFYVAGLRHGDFRRILLAFTCLAAGVLAHYSSAPYALFLAAHYLLFVLPRAQRRWRELAAILLVGAVVLGPWLAWSVTTYGPLASLASPSSVRDLNILSAREHVLRVAGNLRDTLVPHLIRSVGPTPPGPGWSWGGLRDTTFHAYQQTLPFGLGLLGPALMLYELIRSRRPGSGSVPAGRRFWVSFALFTLVTGVAAHATAAPLGLAHVVLQPLVILGIMFLAARFEVWPRAVRWIASAGLGLDVLMGVALHFWFQATPIPGLAGTPRPTGPPLQDLLVGSALENRSLQSRYDVVFIGNDLRACAWIPALLACAALCCGISIMFRRVMDRPRDPAGR